MDNKDEEQNGRLGELEKAEAVRDRNAEESDREQRYKLARLKTYAIVATAVFTFILYLLSKG